MISGNATALTLLLSLSASASAAPDPAALAARLARPAPATTAYVEVRFVDLIKRPLVLRGALEYGADGSLVKRVDSPYRETTTVRAGQVTLERQGKPRREFALSRAPELAAFLESFAALLGGDAARLQQTYALDAEGDDARWQLNLVPRKPALAKHLRRIAVDGAGQAARCFRVEEASGDASFLLVEDAAAAPLPTPPGREALAALCRAAP
jgi:hypothetical protein